MNVFYNVFSKDKFGDEEDVAFSSDYKYCPDCIAKRGEYHMDLCDIEQCQKCDGQLLSCDCINVLCLLEDCPTFQMKKFKNMVY